MEKQLIYFDAQLQLADEKPNQLVGYAMKYNQLSSDRGGYRARFRPNCFKSLTHYKHGQDIKAYYDHNHEDYLGRTDNETLRIEDDGVGLRFAIDLPETSLGNDVRAMIDRKDLVGCSFGYLPSEYEFTEEGEGDDKLLICDQLGGWLEEISVVHDPAFTCTEVALAASQELLNDWLEQEKEKLRLEAVARMRNRLAIAGQEI